MSAPCYIELHARSAFSFLRGASFPEHLADAAAHFGIPAMALCDRDGVYGAPRFFAKAKESGVRPIVGAEITMEDGSILPVLVQSRTGYRNLCRLLTNAHLRSPKGQSAVAWNEIPELAEGLIALTGDEDGPLIRSILAHENQAAANRRRRPEESRFSSEIKSNDDQPVTPSLTPKETTEKLLTIFGKDNVY